MSLKTPIKLCWSSGLKQGRKNFGDWLAPYLIRELTGREVVHAKANHCDLISIGSILQRVKHHFWNRKIHVWGSGFIAPQAKITSHHYYHAVRGKETAKLIKGTNICALGDPGLLVGHLLPSYRIITKKFRIGIVPHYKDRYNPNVLAYIDGKSHIAILDILSEPHDFLQQVASCEFIISSSLHGLIVADAFEIPNAWIELSSVIRGAQFKFRDYYSVFAIDNPKPYDLLSLNDETIAVIVEEYSRPNLAQIKNDLLINLPF